MNFRKYISSYQVLKNNNLTRWSKESCLCNVVCGDLESENSALENMRRSMASGLGPLYKSIFPKA